MTEDIVRMYEDHAASLAAAQHVERARIERALASIPAERRRAQLLPSPDERERVIAAITRYEATLRKLAPESASS
jgi:hypothetical protein